MQLERDTGLHLVAFLGLRDLRSLATARLVTERARAHSYYVR